MKAVLVGNNNYRNYPDESLRGCINDCNNFWMLLSQKMQVPESDISILKDADANEEKDAVTLMVVGQRGPGTHLYWSHSSHGTNNPDPNQKDGLQELLCSSDLAEKDGLWASGFISAKWIGELVAKVRPQDTLNILIDACHSPEGSQLKSIGRSYSRARFLPRSIVGKVVQPMEIKAKEATVPENVALWSACRPFETSADAFINDSWQGAFTAAFLMAWKENRSCSDIIFYARKWLQVNRYSQEPHLYTGKALAMEPF